MNLRHTLLATMLAPMMFAAGRLDAQQIRMGHAATSDVAVRLTGPFVSLRVIGWSHDSVLVTGNLPPTHRLSDVFSGDPREPVRAAKLYIEGPGTIVQKAAILELRVPTGARVWINGGTGSLEVTGVTGELDLNMVGGVVRVTGRPRALNIEAMDATVFVDGFAEWSRIKTAAGNISTSGGSADAAYKTVSGSIVVRGGAFDRGRFESVTGNIAFGGDIGSRASLFFDTHSGSIDVQVSGKSDVSIDAETISGSIENLLTSTRPVAFRDGKGQEIAVELGNGASRVVVRTFRGPVRLVPRQ